MLKSWDTFTRRVIIDRPISDIYPLWTTSEGITKWFLRKAVYTSADGLTRAVNAPCQEGDTYSWEWHNWDHAHPGKIISANGKDHVKFNFESSVVDVQLEIFKDGRTLVSLFQSEIPTDDETKRNVYCGCSSGWTFWLTNLKAYLEHGITLNESGEDLKGHFDGYQLVNT